MGDQLREKQIAIVARHVILSNEYTIWLSKEWRGMVDRTHATTLRSPMELPKVTCTSQMAIDALNCFKAYADVYFSSMYVIPHCALSGGENIPSLS